MAGLFLMFVVTVAFSEMLSGYLKAEDDNDASDCPLVITFTPDDDTQEWVNTPKK